MDGGATIYLALAAAAVSGYSAYASGQAQKEAMQYQAAVARNNQKIAEDYAKLEVAKGQRLEDQKRMETAQRQSAIRVAAAASGFNVDEGSAVRLQEDTAMLGEFDALTIRSNAQRAAHGYRTQGLNYGAQAQLDDMNASSAARSGQLGMWSSIISGASNVSDKWNKWKGAGGNPDIYT